MRHEHQDKGGVQTLVLMVCSAASGGTLQYGYNIAIINAPSAHIQTFINQTCLQRWGAQMADYQVTLIWSFVVSIFSLGGVVGALLAGPMAIQLGRKKSLLVNNLFLMLGSVLAVASRPFRSFEMIILSRLLVGINAGVGMNVQPMYFGECAPKHLRGAVTLSSAVFTAFGLVLGQVVGLREILGSEPCWPFLLASGAIPGAVQLLTLPWFPESPRYLLIDRGDKKGCMEALRQLRGCSVLPSELEEILQEQAAARGVRVKRPWELFRERSMRWQLLCIMVISSGMQLCGNDAIYFYASYVFQEARIPSNLIQYVTIGTGMCEFTASLMCNLLIERVGRRRLLMGGYVLMACWAVVFMVALSLQKFVPGMPYISMACVFAYILSFGLGPAGVTGILPGEVFGQSARPAAYMISGFLMWLNFFLVGMVFPFIVVGFGQFCFVPFGISCVLSAVFIGLVLPESKGKTLTEITGEFDKLNFNKSSGKPTANYQLGDVLNSTSL